MKRNLFILVLPLGWMLSACGGASSDKAKEQAQADSLQRPENISVVAAIAKVEPANGFIELSADVSGIVVESFKKEGDSVQQGEAILRLDKERESLDLATARQEIVTQRARVAAARADISQYEASLREKEEDLAVTKRLAASGADTRQNVTVKEKERDVILANLQAARDQLNAAVSELNTAQSRAAQTEVTANSRLVKAKASGIITSMDIKQGAAITAYQPFAVIAANDSLVLHGEIDEMFADRVQPGQTVDVFYAGTSNTIASGRVVYLSPVLEGKSLFYETPGEMGDRRVRRFKAAITTPASLLINARVECKIKIQ